LIAAKKFVIEEFKLIEIGGGEGDEVMRLAIVDFIEGFSTPSVFADVGQLSSPVRSIKLSFSQLYVCIAII